MYYSLLKVKKNIPWTSYLPCTNRGLLVLRLLQKYSIDLFVDHIATKLKLIEFL
jgi:hypothetical protein